MQHVIQATHNDAFSTNSNAIDSLILSTSFCFCSFNVNFSLTEEVKELIEMKTTYSFLNLTCNFVSFLKNSPSYRKLSFIISLIEFRQTAHCNILCRSKWQLCLSSWPTATKTFLWEVAWEGKNLNPWKDQFYQELFPNYWSRTFSIFHLSLISIQGLNG